MFMAVPHKFTLTLVVYIALVLAFSTVSNAKAYEAVPVRRNHGDLKRLIRKRSPFPQLPKDQTTNFDDNPLGAIGAENKPTLPTTSADVSSPSASSSSTSSTSSTISSASPSSTPVSSSSSSTSSSGGSSLSSTSSVSSSSTSVSANSTSSTTSSTSSPTVAVATPSLNLSPLPQDNTAVGAQSTTVFRTASAGNASPTGEAQVSAASTSTKGITLTVVIVIASVVGGVVILWTIFRKWKLGRSAQFDQRLQPIDWQPTVDDGAIPTHRRANSGASSFHSGTGHGGYGGTSDHGHGSSALNPIPDHDFTAGPTTLAPVGGYADLARGLSPQPQMQEALSRGPSMNRPNYDQRGVPLHHQSGYGAQDTYDYNGARY